MLDDACALYRQNFKVYLCIGALFAGITALASMLLLQGLTGSAGGFSYGQIWQAALTGDDALVSQLLQAQADMDLGRALLALLGSYALMGVQSLLFAPMLQGGCVQAASRQLNGLRLPLGAVLRAAGRKYGRLVATQLAVLLCQLAIGSVMGTVVFLVVIVLIVGLAASVLAQSAALVAIAAVLYVIAVLAVAVVYQLALQVPLMLAVPVAVNEDRCFFSAVGRSFSLLKGSVGQAVAAYGGLTVAIFLLQLSLSAALSGLVLIPGAASAAQVALGVVVEVLLAPLAPILASRFYYHALSKREGYDLIRALEKEGNHG